MNINNNLISSSDAELLVAPYTMEEVKAVTFGLHPNKAPGLDGMTADLFQNYWEFMKRDIWMIAEDFKKKHKFVRELNHTMIVLILKKEDCVTMADFRPISLCNTIYKIISKSMANRLKKIMPNLISENQNGFTPGRELANNIILVVEVLHSIQKGKQKGMTIKLDVAKAYDKVVWYFLVCVLDKFGFPKDWIDCIKFCISSVSFSMIVNGVVYGLFEATNGLRQGDPLSSPNGRGVGKFHQKEK